MANDPEVIFDGDGGDDGFGSGLGTAASAGRPLNYTVKAGDSLSKIAVKLGRAASDWPQLYRSSRAVLLEAQRTRGELPSSGEPNPEKLYAGMVLPLPLEWGGQGTAAGGSGAGEAGDSPAGDVFLSPRVLGAAALVVVAGWLIITALTAPANPKNYPLSSIR